MELRQPVLDVQSVEMDKMDRFKKRRCVFGNMLEMALKWPFIASVKIGKKDRIKASEVILNAFLISGMTVFLK